MTIGASGGASIGADFLKSDISNISNEGKKSFDGQWVNSFYNIQSSASAETEGRTYDVSDGLPDDNYNYEVMVRVWANTGATNGNKHQISLKSDVLTNQAYVVAAVNFGGTAGTQISTAIIPIGAARTLIMQPYGDNTGNYGMAIIAYRRIGTNN